MLLLVVPNVVQSANITADSNKTNLIVTMPEEITIKNASKSETNFFEKSAPWIVALIIGLGSALVNYFISKQLMYSNERNIKSQLESNKENVLIQFKTTLGTKNRQDWIDEVRHNLSEFLSNSIMFKFHKTDKSEAIIKYFEQVTYNLFKLRLLLNEKDELQNKLLDCINKYYEAAHIEDSKLYGKEQGQRDTLIECAKQLFNIHWEKIKKLE